MFFCISLFAISIFLLFVYLNGRWNQHYWEKRGVKFYRKNKVMGPFWEYLTSKKSFFQIYCDIYREYPNEPGIGLGSIFTPSIYVRDLKNIQYVMQGPMFLDRGFIYNPDDLLADNVLFMNGVRWRLMRQKMTPLFTTTKLKSMYYIIDKSSQDFVEYLNKYPDKLKGNTFDTLTTFCCAAIGATVFGVGSGSTFDSPFLDVVKRAFYPTVWSNIRFSIAVLSPKLFKALNLNFFKEFEAFFIGAMKQVFKMRKEEGVKKHDFADICLSLQKNGVMTHESGFELQPTDEILAAQGFFFFIAGAEPVATAVFGALIEIGRHPDVSRKVQEEVDAIFVKHNGQLTYEALSEMEYLDKVLNESLRMFPPIGYLTRQCTEDTVLPEGNIRIEKGTKIFTPIYELHHDPKYYDNPEVFNPDRFTSDARQKLGAAYQPFGYGNRICIGLRYARLQVKNALAHLIHNFKIKTVVGEGGLKYGKDQVQLRMKNVEIEYTPRKENNT